MTMITPSYLGETIEYSSLHACRSTLEDPTEIFPPAYGTYLRLAALARTYLRQHGVSYDRRDDFFNDFHTSDVLASLVEEDIPRAAAVTASLLQRYGIDVPAHTLVVDLEKEHAYA